MNPNFQIFRYPLTILEGHLDTFGHMNNATYLQILEQARWELITAGGFGLEVIRKTKLGPTILEWNLKFLKEITLREKLVIETQLISYEKKIGVLRQDILNEAGELCFQGQMKFGLFDLNARKLVLPTPEWLQAIGVQMEVADARG